ncbi:pirin family protein [Pseudothauera lacus]|uniref:Quercetin 2,3-dioxygenase n=1 Tax=Pseudothauera lacus TaxID=2136175 RepID=A0A2T4IJZ4_9RHOO|nr:pirin family protein [Pseudothauera lacus]PTD98087.1 quercetin 2,3-dioxygenase [Pseudothauera lacus]
MTAQRTELRPAAARGQVSLGWLQSQHSFSFGHYYDPEHVGFSDLLVINEDYIRPARGFDTHGHRDMEIFTYVLDGALEHRDSMGNGSVIRPGDVQVMSAGSGVRHSEYNASRTEQVHLLQIWIVPAHKNLTPGYQQRHFDAAAKRGRLCLILAPGGEHGALTINQDARVHAGLFDGAEHQRFELAGKRYAYVHLARGTLVVNGQRLHAGDALKLRDPGSIELSDGEDAEVLLFDLRPNELAHLSS